MKKSLLALAILLCSTTYAQYTVVFGHNDNIRFINEVTEPETPAEPEIPEDPVEPVKDNASCKTLLVQTPSLQNGIYDIKTADGELPLYCDMSGGGWTLVAVGIRGNISGWATTGDLRLTSSPSTSVGFKLSDSRINSIPKNTYKIVSTGAYASNRYFNGSCNYQHTTVASGVCNISYNNEQLSAGIKTGSPNAVVAGLSDYNPSAGTIYVATSLIGSDTKSGWSMGDGVTAGHSGNAVAGDGGNIIIWVK